MKGCCDIKIQSDYFSIYILQCVVTEIRNVKAFLLFLPSIFAAVHTEDKTVINRV